RAFRALRRAPRQVRNRQLARDRRRCRQDRRALREVARRDHDGASRSRDQPRDEGARMGDRPSRPNHYRDRDRRRDLRREVGDRRWRLVHPDIQRTLPNSPVSRGENTEPSWFDRQLGKIGIGPAPPEAVAKSETEAEAAARRALEENNRKLEELNRSLVPLSG